MISFVVIRVALSKEIILVHSWLLLELRFSAINKICTCLIGEEFLQGMINKKVSSNL